MAPSARLPVFLRTGGIRPRSDRHALSSGNGSYVGDATADRALSAGLFHCLAIVLLAVSLLGTAFPGAGGWVDGGTDWRKRLPIAADIGAKGLVPAVSPGKSDIARTDRRGSGDTEEATVAVRRLVSGMARSADVRSEHRRSVPISDAAGLGAGGRIPTGPPPVAA